MRWLGRILSRYPKSDRAPSARLRLAQIEYARDRRAAARRLLEPLRQEDLDRAGQRAALRLRIALARTPAERMLQLALLRQQIRADASERGRDSVTRSRLESRLAAVDRDIKSLISTAASAELEEMLHALRDRPPTAAILLELARRGLKRQEAYAIVQACAMRVWDEGITLKEACLASEALRAHLSPAEIEDCFDLSRHLRHVDVIFTRVFGA